MAVFVSPHHGVPPANFPEANGNDKTEQEIVTPATAICQVELCQLALKSLGNGLWMVIRTELVKYPDASPPRQPRWQVFIKV
jgi:hypothetical protein